MSRFRFKHFLRERNEYSATGEETLLSVSEYYGVKPRSEAFEGDAGESRAASLEGYRIVKPGDLVMNYMLAWKGAYGLSDFEGITSPAYAVFDVDTAKVDRRFLHHRTRSQDMQVEFKARSKGIIESRLRLYPDALLAMEVELPDLPTQKRIAAFLDRETARIDELIAKKERLVEVLNAKRQATISNFSVKGLHLEVATRDTGISWFGEIPAHWEVQPIKYLVSRPLTDGPHVTPVKCDEGIPFISAESISNGVINFDKKWGYISAEAHKIYSRSYRPKKGDVFVVKLGATAGRVARVETDEDFNIWVPLAAIRPRTELLSKFIYYALQTSQVSDAYQVLWTYGTQQTLGLRTLSNLRLPIPPNHEIEEIIAQIEARLPQIEATMRSTNTSIDRLREYRAALITAAVTGQIDVDSYGKAGTPSATLDRIEEEMQA